MKRAMPAVAQLANAERRFAAMLDRFGLSPSARPRIEIPGNDESTDPAAEYFS
jgi:hypothetical protein